MAAHRRSAAIVIASVLVFSASALAQTAEPRGNVEAGKKEWAVALRCQNCHGAEAQGGFGPDLAGRGLSFEQFRHAVRAPWGVMLAYTPSQLTDQAIADMWAYTSSLAKVTQPAKATFTAPPGSPLAQSYVLDSFGCGQCHDPEIRQPRRVLGGEASDVDYAFFAKLIYEHTSAYPMGRMGNYSRARLPEPVLRDMYKFLKDDLRLLVPMSATVDAGVPAAGATKYTVRVKNTGVRGKGLTAEDITVSLRVGAARVVDATGPGMRKNESAVLAWQVGKIEPQQELVYTITLAGASGTPVQIFDGSRVDYLKPTMRNGAPDLKLVDPRWLGSKNDWVPVTAAPPPPAPPQTARTFP